MVIQKVCPCIIYCLKYECNRNYIEWASPVIEIGQFWTLLSYFASLSSLHFLFRSSTILPKPRFHLCRLHVPASAPRLIPLITTTHTQTHTRTLIPLSPPCLLFQGKYVSVTYLALLTRIKTLLAKDTPDWLSFAVCQYQFPPLLTHLFISIC